jgi:hypothetical protein
VVEIGFSVDADPYLRNPARAGKSVRQTGCR